MHPINFTCLSRRRRRNVVAAIIFQRIITTGGWLLLLLPPVLLTDVAHVLTNCNQLTATSATRDPFISTAASLARLAVVVEMHFSLPRVCEFSSKSLFIEIVNISNYVSVFKELSKHKRSVKGANQLNDIRRIDPDSYG